jgi:protocatechuate 3,4-dioxygenase beta subunit
VRQLLLAAIIAAVAVDGLAQPPQPPGPAGRGQRVPARGAPPRADAPRGTAVLRGQIVAADSGSPIRRAQVRVTSPEARESRVATTDAQGRFEIRELPGGRYNVTASKGGFVSLQFGQRRPSESGTPIELGDGQTIDKLTIALPRGSVLGGRVTDEFGEPVANASVSAWRYAYQAGARRMVPAQGSNSRDTTDDQGHYRLFGLPPGEYYVSATLRGGGPEITDPAGEPSGYAATYYPGTTNVAEAQRVTLAVSQENTGVHFGLIATRLVRVSGQVIMSDGSPVGNGNVMLAPVSSSGGRAMIMQQGGAGNRITNGAFRLPGVAPGRYQLQARAPGANRQMELARMELVVGAEDVEGLTLVTAPGATITGTIVSDTGEPFDFRSQQLMVSARAASPETPAFGQGGGGVRMGTDWTFTLMNIVDPIVIRTSAPQGWTLKTVSLNGQDITDTPMEFPPGQTFGGAQIVMTKKIASLSGAVTDARGKPALDATVVVFPANDKLWTYQSRFIRAARPDQDGQYRIASLPSPEAYLVVAVQGLEDGQAGDPDFLASVRDAATKFELGEGETRSVDVELASPR